MPPSDSSLSTEPFRTTRAIREERTVGSESWLAAVCSLGMGQVPWALACLAVAGSAQHHGSVQTRPCRHRCWAPTPAGEVLL